MIHSLASDSVGDQSELPSEIVNHLKETNKIITIKMFAYLLDSLPMTVDDYGFIRDDSGELIEPYVYDETCEGAGVDSHDMIDYFTPISQASEYHSTRTDIHLSELHSFFTDNGEPVLIHDDRFNLAKFHAETEMIFKQVTSWSSFAVDNGLHDSDEFTVIDASGDVINTGDSVEEVKQQYVDGEMWELELEEELEKVMNGEESDFPLFCLACGFHEDVEEWDETEAHNPVCPDCETEWDSYVHYCRNCEWHGSDKAYEDDEGGMYWEPYCKGCDSIEIVDADESFTGEQMLVKREDDMGMLSHSDRRDPEKRELIERLH